VLSRTAFEQVSQYMTLGFGANPLALAADAE
jgi:hypothetical protein